MRRFIWLAHTVALSLAFFPPLALVFRKHASSAELKKLGVSMCIFIWAATLADKAERERSDLKLTWIAPVA